ncbi:MAG: ABC transporter permease [Chloroflexi bacterium]|nr:ABC transporter permease [Chloroflexota bacterium]
MSELSTTYRASPADDRFRTRSRIGLVYLFIRRWPILPGIVLAALVFSAIFAPWIAPQAPNVQALRDRNAPPVWLADEEGTWTQSYLLGADQVGRDVLSRIIHGARISLAVAGVALLSGLLVGVTLGLVAAWYGGVIDEVIARAVDIWHALPFLLVAIVVVTLFGGSLTVLMGVLAMVSWAGFVRNVRADVLTLREREYVLMARVCGASAPRVIVRHILPGVIPTIMVIATLAVGGLILTEATLSFLGAGIPAPTPSWGLMVSEGREYLTTAWWSSFFPGLAIFLVVMSLNFMGDWIRDFTDPRLRQQAD